MYMSISMSVSMSMSVSIFVFFVLCCVLCFVLCYVLFCVVLCAYFETENEGEVALFGTRSSKETTTFWLVPTQFLLQKPFLF